MRIKILGSVSPVVTSDDNCPGYLIDKNLLLDCGSVITRNLKVTKRLKDLTIIISHLHKDHYLDLYGIIYLVKEHLKDNRRPKININIYLPKNPDEIVTDIKEECVDYSEYIRINTYNEKTKITVDNKKIDFISVKHSSSVPCYAIRIKEEGKTIVYTGDTSNKSKEELIEFGKDSDVMIMDAKYLHKNKISNNSYHLTSLEASIIAKEANTKRLVLTHLPSLLKDIKLHKKEAEENFKKVLVAEAKMIIKI